MSEEIRQRDARVERGGGGYEEWGGRERKWAWGRLAATHQYCHRILRGLALGQGCKGITVLGMSSGRHGLRWKWKGRWGTEKVTVR